MTNILAILLSVITLCSAQWQSADTTSSVTAGQSVENTDINLILDTFNGQAVSELLPKIDMLIATGRDTEEKSMIAYYIFEYYYRSRIMGYEECALYVADNYFLNGTLKAANDGLYMTMKMFAEFNRSSMIGMQAPALTMQDRNGKTVTLPEGNDYKYTILYFYDDECSSCKIQTPKIMNYLTLFYEARIHVYRIYTQKDFRKWQEYTRELDRQYPCPDNVVIEDTWDPEIDSDFPTKYGVISTPQLFLLNAENRIIGRKLNAEALAQLIQIQQEQPDEFDIFFDKIFKPLRNQGDEAGLDTLRAHKLLEAFYLDSKNDAKLYDEVFYRMYLYLKGQNDYEMQKLAVYLAEKYILGQPDLWLDVQFSPTENTGGEGILKGDYTGYEDFMANTAIAIDLFRRNPLGEPCTDLILRTPKNKKTSIYDSKAEYTVLYFYSLDCAVCEAVENDMKAIYDRFKDKDIRFIAINTGKDKAKWKKHLKKSKAGWEEAWDPKRKSDMFNKYDLSDVPAIYLLDNEKRTLAKDIPPIVLNDILTYLLEENK